VGMTEGHHFLGPQRGQLSVATWLSALLPLGCCGARVASDHQVFGSIPGRAMKRSSTWSPLPWWGIEARSTLSRCTLCHMLNRLRRHDGERPLLILDCRRERVASHALLTGFELSRE
jgi:hypothetical protein